MVLVVGNHSAGKSTFINSLMGIAAQETGVAPTDDGFTVLERQEGKDMKEDGPTLLGCPDNRPYRELQRFGQSFWGHLKRKKLALPMSATMPFGLQIIDTPGMIDMPANNGPKSGRGYNFLEVVRWFAKRADLILLLFDPDRPGTTGETLDVLTQSLAGLDHKFLIVLNKVDQLDSSVDFARAYGTLCWALSKVIFRKDLPMIYTMYNDVLTAAGADRRPVLPLDAFRKKRFEVIDEVFRSKVRHWDNIITGLEDTLRQVEMVTRIMIIVRKRVWSRRLNVVLLFALMVGFPSGVGACTLRGGPAGIPWPITTCFVVICSAAAWLLRESCSQFERFQHAYINTYFNEAYHEQFIHTDGEDLRGRWVVVRPIVANILEALKDAKRLPRFNKWEGEWINEVLKKDIWYLRQLARGLRTEQSSE